MKCVTAIRCADDLMYVCWYQLVEKAMTESHIFVAAFATGAVEFTVAGLGLWLCVRFCRQKSGLNRSAVGIVR